jgi:mRNA-degrading endonuclease toxin of MazEF toxin-antitoxin module
VVPFTSAKFDGRKDLPNCVPFLQGQFGFTANCVAQAEQISKIPTHALVTEQPAFTINEDAMRRIVRAIGDVIRCRCEPFEA